MRASAPSRVATSRPPGNIKDIEKSGHASEKRGCHHKICPRLTSKAILVRTSTMKMFRRGYGAAVLALVATSMVPSESFNLKSKSLSAAYLLDAFPPPRWEKMIGGGFRAYAPYRYIFLVPVCVDGIFGFSTTIMYPAIKTTYPLSMWGHEGHSRGHLERLTTGIPVDTLYNPAIWLVTAL